MNEPSVDARGRSKNSRLIALLGSAGALALTIGGVTLATAPAASADGDLRQGNVKCADVITGAPEGIKFESPQLGVASMSENGVMINLTVRALVADDPDHEPGDQTGDHVADFTAVGGTVLVAIVKGGPNATVYDYRPGGTVADLTGIHPPVNPENGKFHGISHIEFCVGEGTTPPPTTDTPPPTTDTPPPTTDTPPPTTDTPPPTTDTPPPTTDTPAPSESPSESPSGTPSESPSESTPPVAVPTDIDAGAAGDVKNASAITSTQGTFGIGLLCLGGVLLIAGGAKTLQRRGQHSA